MLNFCIFVFILYFLKKMVRMIFPKKVIIHKEVVIAQYGNIERRKTKRKASRVTPKMLNNRTQKDKTPYKKCA